MEREIKIVTRDTYGCPTLIGELLEMKEMGIMDEGTTTTLCRYIWSFDDEAYELGLMLKNYYWKSRKRWYTGILKFFRL